jgi:uncharacterized secreted protein with C-terminal beta-propeller domain
MKTPTHWKYQVNDIMKRCKNGEVGTHLEMEELIQSLLPTHSIDEEIVERLCKYFDWEENSEQAHTIIGTLFQVRSQAYSQGREDEREKVIGEIKVYAETLEKYHSDMIGTTHIDNKMMLMYDAHSRQIAIKHLLNILTHPKDK